MTSAAESSPELYFDANATTPVLPAAIEAACLAMQSNYGNPSSTHSSGLRASVLLDAARASAHAVLGTTAGQIIFTSGATEGIQTAILSALHALRAQRIAHPHAAPNLLLYGATEHKAVPATLQHWNELLDLGCEIDVIPVGEDGRHDLAFLALHAPRAALICTMAVNNESGVISDLDGIRRTLDACGSQALWLVDSVQALGKITLDLDRLRIDYAPFSGHKLYAPKGIGMLYVRPAAPFMPLLAGGGQETGQRGGTENMPGIAAFGAVLDALRIGSSPFQDAAVLHGFRSQLADALRAAFAGIVFNTPFDISVSTTLNFSVAGLSSREMMNLFDAAGMRVSSGSACNSSKTTRSFVLDAMGLCGWRSAGAVRFSFGPATQAAQIDEACLRIARAGTALRVACVLGEGRAGNGAAPAGLLQLRIDGANAWILADAANERCVIIDPLPALVERITQSVQCRGLRLAAILTTDDNAMVQEARARLCALLATSMDVGNPAKATTIQLADASGGDAIQLGDDFLTWRRVDDGSSRSTAYLLGHASAGTMPASAVHSIFCGDLLSSNQRTVGLARLAELAHSESVLLPSNDEPAPIASTLQVELGKTLPPDRAASVSAAQPLAQFLQTSPAAILIDVREAYEFSSGQSWIDTLGHPTINVPLTQIAGYLPAWLENKEQTLLFVCRTGNRSGEASHCLRRLGHPRVWHVEGGIALAGDVTPA